MSTHDVFELRREGRLEEAYAVARQLYATDKSPYVALAMFWTAVDVLRSRAAEDRTDEAEKILLALERMLPRVPDKEGWVHDAFTNCQHLLGKATKRSRQFGDGPEHLQLGVWGEELAAAYLREKGYIILDRDWHSTHRDIDIIARNTDYVVFVEVKTRHTRDFGDPVLAINSQKRKNIRRAMNHYVRYHHFDVPMRFDIITVVGTIGTTEPEISHYENVNIIELSPRR